MNDAFTGTEMTIPKVGSYIMGCYNAEEINEKNLKLKVVLT